MRPRLASAHIGLLLHSSLSVSLVFRLFVVLEILPEELHEGKSIAVLFSDACAHNVG